MKSKVNINTILVILLPLGLVGISLLIIAFGGKVIPGGPFISVFGELIPLLILVFFLFVEFKLYIRSNLKLRRWFLLVVCFTVLLIGFILFNNLSFWFDPYSRGRLFGI